MGGWSSNRSFFGMQTKPGWGPSVGATHLGTRPSLRPPLRRHRASARASVAESGAFPGALTFYIFNKA